jgi:penicillin-binding protein 2
MEMYLNGKIAPERKYIEERILQSNTILYSGVKKH